MDSNVEFVCCDMPTANRLTIHILAAVAEHEREMNSARTKAALQEAKRRGTKLGNPQLDQARQIAHKRWREIAAERAANVVPIIRDIERSGATSFRAIAEALNARGIKSPRGGVWYGGTVRNALRLVS